MEHRFVVIEGKIGQIEGKLEAMEGRVTSLEEGQTLILADTSRVLREIGRPPNLATNDPGDGMQKVIYRMAAVMLKGANVGEPAMPSIITVDTTEGEITSVQNREDLVARCKSAEGALRVLKEEAADKRKEAAAERRERRKFWIAVIIAVIGSLAAIIQAIGSLVRHEQASSPSPAPVHRVQEGPSEPR